MSQEDRNTLIAVAVIFLFFMCSYAGMHVYSGHDPYFSVVTSQSMQHDDDSSSIGIIDTGDLVYVRDKSKLDIQTYLQGLETGFMTFGDYGSVIIYKTGDNSNVIHRALLIIEVKEDSLGKYASIPNLDTYPSWNSRYSPGSDLDPEMLREDITLNDVGYRGIDVNIDIEFILSRTEPGVSGYVTMGDNNSIIDQSPISNSSFIISGLVTYDMIVSIPVLEVPWIGSIKLILDERGIVVDNHAPNSIPDFIIFILTMSLILFSIYIIWMGIAMEYKKKNKTL